LEFSESVGFIHKVQLSDLYSSMASLFDLISEMGGIKTPCNFHRRFSNLISAAT